MAELEGELAAKTKEVADRDRTILESEEMDRTRSDTLQELEGRILDLWRECGHPSETLPPHEEMVQHINTLNSAGARLREQLDSAEVDSREQAARLAEKTKSIETMTNENRNLVVKLDLLEQAQEMSRAQMQVSGQEEGGFLRMALSLHQGIAQWPVDNFLLDENFNWKGSI